MKKIQLVVLFFGLLLLTSCGTKDATTYETIDIDEIESKVEEGYQVLDVREVDEFVEGHIENAQNKPLSVLKEDNFDGLDKKERYVVICRSGNRSQEASQILFDKGYEVLNVSEGMSSWIGVQVTGE